MKDKEVHEGITNGEGLMDGKRDTINQSDNSAEDMSRFKQNSMLLSVCVCVFVWKGNSEGDGWCKPK